MISKDQPKCFSENVLAAVSSRDDGTMLDKAIGVHDGTIVSNRTEFCDKLGIDYGDVVFQRIIYSPKRTYDLIAEVDDGSTAKWTSEVVADGLFTRSKNVAMMLPVADCAGTVIHDPQNNFLALLHLGRHSTLVHLLGRMIDKFFHEGSKVEDLVVWMGPSIQMLDYRMEYFSRADDPSWQGFYEKKSDGYYIDMQGYNAAICEEKGVLKSNIHISPVNTATDDNYFSHFYGDVSDRFAVVAVMR